MGNTLIEDKGRGNVMKSFYSYVEQNPELGVRTTVFFENKLFKTMSYKSHQMNSIVKVHVMRKQITLQELYIHECNFQYLWNTIGNRNYPNLLPFHKMINFNDSKQQIKPAQLEMNLDCGKDYLAVARQQVAQTLDDRLQTNYKLPKCLLHFITLQILNAVQCLHGKKLYHGNLKSSNVLLTSSDHVMIADFASYKPYLIKEDQLGDFRNLFQTVNNKCYIAPEKFISPQEPIESIAELQELANRKFLKALQSMDMFSVGCIIAEIYTSESVFSLEQLIQYRKGEYDPSTIINKVENQQIKEIVKKLIQIDPSARLTAAEAFDQFYQVLNPNYELLYYLSTAFNTCIHFMQPDIRIGIIRKLYPMLDQNKTEFKYVLPLAIQKMNLIKFIQLVKTTPFPHKVFNIEDQQNKFSQIFQSLDIPLIDEPFENLENLKVREFKECIVQFQNSEQKQVLELQDRLSLSQVQKLKQSVQTLKRTGKQDIGARKQLQNLTLIQNSKSYNSELMILINMLFIQIKNSRFMQSKLCGIELVDYLMETQDDETKYIFIMPQLCYLLDDTEYQVQLYALTVLLKLLQSIKNPFNSSRDYQLFRLYVWEQLMKLYRVDDTNSNKIIAITSAQIASILYKYQNHMLEWAKDKQDLKIPNYLTQFMEIVTLKLRETKSLEIQQLLIQNIGEIYQYFDPFKTEQDLLTLISAFNNPDLRIPLLKNLFKIYQKQGQNPKNAEILLMLVDFKIRNELQLFYTIQFLRQVVEQNLFTLDQEKSYLNKIAPLLLFPNQWIKNEAFKYTTALLLKHNSMEIFLHFQPILIKYMKQEIPSINPQILEMLLGQQFNHKIWFDFNQNKMNELLLPDNFNQRDRQIFENYINNFIKQSRMPAEKDDKQEKQKYDIKFQKVTTNKDLQVNLGQKVNEFLGAAFKSGILLFVLQEENVKKLDEYQYLNQRGVDLRSELNLRKLKFLQEYCLQLMYNSNIDTEKILSTTQHRNLLNSILIVNAIELKTRQIQFKDDIPLYKSIIQPPAMKPFKVQGNLVTTITEHKDIVSCVQGFKEAKYFISGSHDGTIKFYDLQKIEMDFTYGSLHTIKIQENDAFSKVTALKTIEASDNFIVGTNTGNISLYKAEQQASTFKKADSEIIKIESLKNEFSEQVFVYITNTGNLSVEDTRARSSVKFQVGKQRGLITNMVQKQNLSTLVSTLNGYLMVYDIRCNLISSVFQLLNHDEQPLPIFSISNFSRVTNLEGVSGQELVALGYQSNNNEIGFWDLNELNENLNPQIYLCGTDKKNSIIQTPRLKNLYKNEQFTNYSNNLHERSYYDFVGSYQQMDLLAYLKDPLTSSQRQIKEKWLKQTKNIYTHLKSAFEAKCSASQLLCLNTKTENTIVSASTDRTIQSWTLMNDGIKTGERNFEKEGSTNVISSPFNQIRKFIQCKSGDVYVIQDYEQKTQTIVKSYEQKTEHKDCITDMVYLERDPGLLITSSRDYSIKIWK